MIFCMRATKTVEARIPRWLPAMGLCLSAVLAIAQQPASSAGSPPPSIASVMDRQLSVLESQFVPAAEAMPADRYSFAPGGSEFRGVRTFALEVRHAATANFVFYSAILGEDPPPGASAAGAANGPADLETKDQILQYLKDSFALGHKALATLTAENATVPLAHTPVPSMNSRLALASFIMGHAWDHYGQMVEYLRMNGIVPPASQGQPPANPVRAD
jgi:uncharacterized damage-inducible protein DinB